MTSAITLAATALIVPGTGTHNVDQIPIYRQNARDRFIAPAANQPPAPQFECSAASGCVPIGVPYPASFWPIPLPDWCPGLSCDKWNVSVAAGVTSLETALAQVFTVNPNENVVLFGYSQGGQVVTNAMYDLANSPNKDQIQVVTIGNIGNPQGLWSRFNFFPGFTVPILDVTFGPQLPTNIGIKSTNYVFEYDPVGDAPLNWWNPLAVLNALAAFQYVHGNYLVPNENDLTGTLPYGYTDATLAQTIQGLLSNCTEGPGSNCRTYQDAKFVLIPWQGTLPILQPLMDLADSIGITPLVKPFVDLIQPALKVLIDLGYDRIANPGIPRTMNLIPIFNPIKLAVDLVNAVGQGIEAFIKDITGSASTPAPAPVAPPVSTLAAGENGSAKLARVDETEPNDQSQLDSNVSVRHLSVDASANDAKLSQKVDSKLDSDGSVDPLKVDVKPQTGATVESKKQSTDDDTLNSAFTISTNTTTTTTGTGSTATTKTNDPNLADVIELKPRQGESETTGTTTTTGTTSSTTTTGTTTTGTGTSTAGTGEQQQSQPPAA